MKKKFLLIFVLIFFILSIKNVFADSTVFVTATTVYKITGETKDGITRYIVDIERTGTTPQGSDRNITIFNHIVPFHKSIKDVLIYNSTGQSSGLGLDVASSQLIEQGPVRVYVYFENKTSSMCWTSPEVVCMNFSVETFAYPRYYLRRYYLEGNYSKAGTWPGDYWQLPYYVGAGQDFRYGALYYFNGTYRWAGTSATANIEQIHLAGALMYNETGHNTTFGFFFTDLQNIDTGGDNRNWHFWVPAGYYWTHYAYATSKNSSFTYLTLFADSGQQSLANNETVWLGFKEQWFDFYYPASVFNITGSYFGRDNITSTYNFTVGNNGLLRFNFSTNGIKHFLPVFHIKGITSNSSYYKDHIWYKNYSKPNPQWEKLTNYTDFVIQDGNSSYFGYNYILLLINKTLGSDYEFWISNDTDPAGIFTRKIANWNKTLMVWNDTNQTSAFTLKYSITGLKPNCYYNVYNNSVLTYSMLYTDSQGNLPSFTIYLDSEKEIKVEEYPVVSVLLSDELVRGIFFTNKTGAEINTQYRVDLNDWNNATWNYNASDSNKKTEYWIQNNGTTLIDVCQKAENDLTCYPGEPCGTFTIAIANVSWSNSTYNNITFPEYDTSKRLALTYSTNKTAYSLSVGSSIYLRYWFFAPSYAPSGRYNTTISFKAVGAGEDC